MRQTRSFRSVTTVQTGRRAPSRGDGSPPARRAALLGFVAAATVALSIGCGADRLEPTGSTPDEAEPTPSPDEVEPKLDPAAPVATTLQLALSPASLVHPSTTVLSAHVVAASGAASGTVVASGAGAACTIVVDQGFGSCTLTPTVIGRGQAVAGIFGGGGALLPSAATVLLDVAAAPTVTPPVSYCAGDDAIVPVAWPDVDGQVRPRTTDFWQQTLAFEITVPMTFSRPLDPTHLGFVHIAEVPGGQVTMREVTVSRHPCDFASDDYLYMDDAGNTAPGVNFTVNNPDYFRDPAIGAQMNWNSGETWYVNLRNRTHGVSSCDPSFGNCNILFDFAVPTRY